MTPAGPALMTVRELLRKVFVQNVSLFFSNTRIYLRSVYLAGTSLQTLTAIVPALVGCPEHSTLGDAKSSSLALGVG